MKPATYISAKNRLLKEIKDEANPHKRGSLKRKLDLLIDRYGPANNDG